MPEPVDVLELGEAARKRLGFLVAAHGLTGVQRLNRLLDGSRGETSAEHSWHLALAALVLGDDTELDMARVLGMLLVHDVVEVDAGDVPIYDVEARLAIVADEERAAARLFGLLPAGTSETLHELWREFEAAETPEARFARALDRLQPILVHWAGTGAAWAERGTTVAEERELAARVAELWPPFGPVATALIDDALTRGLLREG
ncbi:MAG: metal-dependent phosphohydrolase sub domain [Solirubrobacterales bacterium]|nr:metal-dependent phosphohydrolase sub domain [Solirubrobacterales bacterium]